MIQEATDGSVILVDKPLQWTSFDVVKKLRYGLKVKKIGHAGTLDPLATGLLILCTGKMTKQIDTYQAQEKEYTGTFIIGKTTPSYDLETEVTDVTTVDHITQEDVSKAVVPLTGEIQQVPPVYSAIKVDGKRAYESAREGKSLKLSPRTVTVRIFDAEFDGTDAVNFRIVCSKGTYVRSLAHDFGELLGTGAYLSELRRTRIGNFRVENASTIEEIISRA
jgi:tRNA pseudouridine55 synthase